MKRIVRNILWMALGAVLVAGLIFLVQQQQNSGATHEAQQELMGTIVKIKAYGKGLSRERFDEVSRSAFAEIARLEKEMSEWIPESPISQAARFAGKKAVPVSEEIVAVIDLSLAISRQTGGAFDISFKPLGRLWRVEKRKEPPREEEIRAALRLVDYRNITLDKGRRTLFLKHPGMAVGLGAIAKGYAAGRAARKMAEGGIRDFIIDAGGDLYFSGSKGKQAWTCGIQDPDRRGEQLIRLKVKTDCAVVTSGDYERYFDFQGRRYHHIIDTRTGYPATGTRSVTVLARDPAVADAYATSFFILGPVKAAEIAGRNPGVAFILIDDRGKVWRGGPVLEFVEEMAP
ncbi:MAG: FAD:protein FMN transferase [Deltaproteobacteria bacterium]|nr:FAD:protein FMN transferase [Deltaproteobacteria bacterium]